MKRIWSILFQQRGSVVKITALVLLYFGINSYLSFATDTFATFSTGFYGAGLDMAMRNGRPVIGVMYILYALSGLSNVSFYYISSLLALLFLVCSVWIYQSTLTRYGVKENIGILLAFASVANIFIIEYFMFIEKCGFMLAILLNVIGVYWIEKFFDDHKIRHCCFSMVSMILAAFTYQGTIALFVILSMPFASRRAKTFRQYFLNGTAILVTYISSALINLLAFRFIFKNTRISAEINYFAQLKSVLEGVGYNSKFTFNILPPYVFLTAGYVCFFTALVWSMVYLKKRLWRILNVFNIVIAAFLFSTASIIQGSGWWSTRVVYPLASVVAVLAINIFIDEKETMNIFVQRILRITSLLAILLVLLFQYFAFNKIYIDKYKSNALDEYRYTYIYQEICDYKESTGKDITQIAFYEDAKRYDAQYRNLYDTGDLVVSAFTTPWSDISAMNYYLKTNYVKVDPEEKYKEYFSGKDWNCLSQEQLIFDEDTLHLCVY